MSTPSDEQAPKPPLDGPTANEADLDRVLFDYPRTEPAPEPSK